MGNFTLLSATGVNPKTLSRFNEDIGAGLVHYSLVDLRGMGILKMTITLFSITGEINILVDSKSLSPNERVMAALCLLAVFASKHFVSSQGVRKRLGFVECLLHAFFILLATMRNMLFVAYASTQLFSLTALGRASLPTTRPLSTELISYINCNLWFGNPVGGSVGHTAGVVNGFARKNHHVMFTSFMDNDLIDSIVDKNHVRTPRYFGFPWTSNNYYLDYLVCRNLKNMPAPSLIYQRLSLGNFSGVKEKLRTGAPLIIEYNGSEVWIAENWGRASRTNRVALKCEEVCLTAADRVVCISKPLKDELVQRGIDPRKIVVYPNGVDPEMFNPRRFLKSETTRLRAGLGIGEAEFVFGFIGTFGVWHGVEILAQAFANTIKSNMDWCIDHKVHLLLIGDGEMRPRVESILSDIGSGFYTLTGAVPQTDAPMYLAACDVLCAPHKRNEDGSPFFGSPTKLFEYMAMQKPIIASNLDQLGEVLREEKMANGHTKSFGFLTEPGSLEDLENVMLAIVDDVKRSEIAFNARQRVLEKYTWAAHVDAVLDQTREQS